MKGAQDRALAAKGGLEVVKKDWRTKVYAIMR